MTAWLDADELQRAGYLQEVNRLFFHPLGLALAIGRDSERDPSVWVAGVLDHRDDPEGVVFDIDGNQGTLTDEDSRAKAENVTRLWNERFDARTAAVGYMIQPVEGTGAER